MENQETKKYLQLVPLLVIILVTVGTLGYMAIEGWLLLDAFYMVTITLSTIGFKEVHPLSPAGQVFTIILIILGIGIIAYTFRWFSEYVLEGRLKGSFKARKMDKKIKNLKDHYIICGCGRVGRQIAQEFALEKVPFVITDRNPEHLKRAEEAGWFYIYGDAGEEEILQKAGVKKARGLLTVVDEDPDNVFITLTARALNPDLFIVARASYEENIPKLKRAGADRVATPYKIGGYQMAALALRPVVVDFLETVITARYEDLILEEIALTSNSPLVGKTLEKELARKKTGITVLALNKKDGRSLVTPTPETILEAKDKLVLLGKKDDLDKIKEKVKATRLVVRKS